MKDEPVSEKSPSRTRREREFLEHKKAILLAAERIFVEKGFQGTKISEIARAAEFSVGSIYNFFPCKMDICHAVMDRIAQERTDEMKAILEEPYASFDDAFCAFIREWFTHHIRHAAFLHMMMEMPHKEPPPETFIRCIEGFRVMCIEFFRTGLDLKYFKNLPPDTLFDAFEGVCRGLSFRRKLGQVPMEPSVIEQVFIPTLRTLFAEYP